jgi:hypothetical protein
MQETKDPKSTEVVEGGTPQSKDSEATSSETLSEIEETEKVSDEKNGGGASSTPSPDGAFDGERGGREDAGPM